MLASLLDNDLALSAGSTDFPVDPATGPALVETGEFGAGDGLTDGYEWNRVHAATAIWDIGGESEAPVVLDTLLQVWQQNSATGNHVAACLNRMGSAAIPALPQTRAELARPERGIGSEVPTTIRN